MPKGVHLNRAPWPDRFWRRVAVGGAGECWLWQGPLFNGYGFTGMPGERGSIGVHRIAYLLMVGPISEGLELDHLCRVRHCVNPAHLEPVTHRENNARSESVSARLARMTHCKRGHPFDEANTYRIKGARICRACRRDYARLRAGRLERQVV